MIDTFQFDVALNSEREIDVVDVCLREPIQVIEVDVESAIEVVEVDVGQRGERGQAGVGTSGFDIVAAVDLHAGQPVCVDADGHAALASAGYLSTSRVVGLAAADQLAGETVICNTQSLSQDDWTTITGHAQLIAGAKYYLGLAPGTLTTASPIEIGHTVVDVGIAVSATTMLLCNSYCVLL